MEHLITIEELSQYTRKMYPDEDLIPAYIDEAEQIDIKKNIGDELFINLIENKDEKYKTLLEGGEYTTKCGNTKIFKGLKCALSYYVYARIVQFGSEIQTRFGFVGKDDEYSTKVDSKNRYIASNEARNIANQYLSECLEYIQNSPYVFPNKKCCGSRRKGLGRMKVRAIGD